ncbi:MAG TPA: hypothetical protein VG142_07160 [Trebonia sp.]|jgi:hypothetical protein|nr:hypothetical protein [Trebonia sp.]
MIKRAVAIAVAVSAVVLGLTGQAAVASTPGPAQPDAGTSTHNASLCGTNEWTYITVVPRLKAHDSAGSCIDPEEYHADFAVTKITKQIGWQFPNLSDGWEMGESGCPSTADMKDGLCSQLPVQWRDDGTPVASGQDYLARSGTYNDAFDIWLAPVRGQTEYGGPNDTEVMIWLAHPGIDDESHYIRYANIGGQEWGVMSWETVSGTRRWRYVAYLAPRTSYGTLTYHDLWINEFLRYTAGLGYLGSDYWLLAIDKGFEIVNSKGGMNISKYSLGDLR